MYKVHDNTIEVCEIKYFDLAETLNCGQCFRFEEISHNSYRIIVKNCILNITTDNNHMFFHDIDEDDFKNMWFDYFDFGTDYNEIMEYLSLHDKKFNDIAKASKGIRILKQEPWEALCSFIISQNNNIPRIKGIIQRLCENFGEKIGKSDYFSFPAPNKLANLKIQDLDIIRSGFRAKYIIDAAQKVSSREVNLNKVSELDVQNAANELMKIKGVGIKVSMCTLLYGFHKLDAFPEDVWIKRAMEQLYKNQDYKIFGKYAGVAQQYIFNYIRNTGSA